ncbi:MAG: hypothetical protein Q7R92_03840 [bacterium]|nr:hypothetical protein [bacterium]
MKKYKYFLIIYLSIGFLMWLQQLYAGNIYLNEDIGIKQQIIDFFALLALGPLLFIGKIISGH